MANADFTTQPAMRVAVQKPKFGIYYALLIIALLALVVACSFLYAYIKSYGGFGTVKGKVSAVARSQELLVASSGIGLPGAEFPV